MNAIRRLFGGPSWSDQVEFAQLLSHPAIQLRTPRIPSILLWRLSAVTSDGKLVAPIGPDGFGEPFDDETISYCQVGGMSHEPPAAGCFCGVRAVERVGGLREIAEVFTSHRHPQATTTPVIHRVELLDAYDFGCESIDDPKWRPLKIRLFGENVLLSDPAGTYRARAMRIKPGPVFVSSSTPMTVQAKLVDRYGVPVHQLDAADVAGLVVAAAAEVGEPALSGPAGSRHWVRPTSPACQCGETHFGSFGAAGVLAVADGRVLLQRRSSHVQHPGTWALPGGALQQGEKIVNGAVRELAEEVDFGDVEPRFKILGTHTTICAGGWTYSTVLSMFKGGGCPEVAPLTSESDMVKWVPIFQVPGYSLHPALSAQWPDLLRRLDGGTPPPSTPYRVAVVCYGNICRSPIAEVILRRMFDDAGLDVTVTSGGVDADVGFGADPLTLDVLERHGLDGTTHRGRQVTAGWFDTFDLILTSSDTATRTLRQMAPDEESAAKIRLLREYDPDAVAAGDLEVANPWKGTSQDFEDCYTTIEAACRGVAKHVAKQLKEKV